MTTRGEPFLTYTVCDVCGFRLMRVEHTATTFHAFCPVCGQECNEHGVQREGARLAMQGRYQAWITWLQSVGLSYDELQRIYHLNMSDFFDDAVTGAHNTIIR